MSDRAKPKSQPVQLVLALLLGPLGLLYSSLPAAVLLALAALVFARDTSGEGALLTWPLAVVTGFLTVRHWNRRAASRAGAVHPDSEETSHVHSQRLDDARADRGA